MPLRMIPEDRKEIQAEQARRKAGRRKSSGTQTAIKPSKPPRPSAGPGSLKSKPKPKKESFLDIAKKTVEEGGSPKLKTSEDRYGRAINTLTGSVRNRPGDNAMKKGGMNKMLSGGQAKIAAKAPPTNKIDEKDFAVLRAEKAKGRGQGLQDEKMKPGKPMKANLGLLAMKKAKDKGAKGMDFLSPMMMAKRLFNKKKGGVMKANKGKMFTAEQKKKFPGLAKAGSVEEFLKRKREVSGKGKMTFSDKMKAQDQGLINKKTGEGAKDLMKRSKSVTLGKRLLVPVALGIGAVQFLKGKMKDKKDKPKKKMGGGMMQRPMGMAGYKKGTMIKARGGGMARTKPTKMY